MMINVLAVLNEEMLSLGLDYEFEERTEENHYPYWIGTADVIDDQPEYGGCEGTITLYGFSMEERLKLLQEAESIQNHFENFIVLKDGIAISIEFNSALNVSNDTEPRLKRIDITLEWKAWKGASHGI